MDTTVISINEDSKSKSSRESAVDLIIYPIKIGDPIIDKLIHNSWEFIVFVIIQHEKLIYDFFKKKKEKGDFFTTNQTIIDFMCLFDTNFFNGLYKIMKKNDEDPIARNIKYMEKFSKIKWQCLLRIIHQLTLIVHLKVTRENLSIDALEETIIKELNIVCMNQTIHKFFVHRCSDHKYFIDIPEGIEPFTCEVKNPISETTAEE